MPMPFSAFAAMIPAIIVPWPLSVLGGAADEAPGRDDPAREVGMPEIDARVDHGDVHRGERRQRRPGVVGSDAIQVPLLRHERIRRA